jgi:IS30 family transposase
MTPPQRTPLGQISGNGKINSELTTAERNQILGAALCGVKQAEIARRLDYHPATIAYTIKKASTRPPTQASVPRSGRPKSLSDRDARSLIRSVRREPKTTYRQLSSSLNLGVSRSTYKRFDPSIQITMASRSAPLAAQKKRRRMSTQTKKGTSSHLLLYCAIILTFAAPKHQGISKATRRSERIQNKNESSRSNAKDSRELTEQEACLR